MAQENRKPVPRRSSLIAKQFAEEEGVQVQISDLFRTLPPNVQAEVARQSNSRRSSNLAPNSINPTPLSSVRSKGSGIPIRPNSSVRKTAGLPLSLKSGSVNNLAAESTFNMGPKYRPGSNPNNTSAVVPQSGNRAAVKPPKPPPSNASRNMSAARQKMGSMQNLARNPSLSFRKSMSMESICRDNGLTPGAYTPNWRTPSTSNAVRNSEMSQFPGCKTIKAPNSTDKATLFSMAEHITEFIQSKNYPRHWTSRDFLKITSHELINVCVFVGSLMMGSPYFQKPDLTSRIFELSKVLKYPGTITKSHLKAPNIPNSQPYVLTFLSWLCSRVEGAISPDISQKPISEISQTDYRELAAESYLALFLHELNSGGVEDPEVVEAELEEYKAKLQERFMSDIPHSTEELVALRDEALEQLNQLENTPNPAKNLMDEIVAIEKLSKDTQDKLEESKKKWKVYKDLASLHSEAKFLHSKLEEKEKEVQEVQNTIRTQTLDKRQQLQMMEEIETMKNQIQAIATITNKLDYQVETTKITKTNLEKKFYAVCSKFTVVECFQQAVKRLRLDIPSVAPNPYEPTLLKQWIIEVEKIQSIASKKISALQKEIQEKLTKMERNKKQRQQALRTVEAKREDLEEKLNNMEVESERCRKERETQLVALVEAENEIEEVVALLENEKTAMEVELNTWIADCDELQKEFEKEKSTENDWRQKAEDLTIEVMEEGSQMSVFLDDYCVNKVAQIREIRLQNNLDVSDFDILLEEYAKANIYPKPAE